MYPDILKNNVAGRTPMIPILSSFFQKDIPGRSISTINVDIRDPFVIGLCEYYRKIRDRCAVIKSCVRLSASSPRHEPR